VFFLSWPATLEYGFKKFPKAVRHKTQNYQSDNNADANAAQNKLIGFQLANTAVGLVLTGDYLVVGFLVVGAEQFKIILEVVHHLDNHVEFLLHSGSIHKGILFFYAKFVDDKLSNEKQTNGKDDGVKKFHTIA